MAEEHELRRRPSSPPSSSSSSSSAAASPRRPTTFFLPHHNHHHLLRSLIRFLLCRRSLPTHRRRRHPPAASSSPAWASRRPCVSVSAAARRRRRRQRRRSWLLQRLSVVEESGEASMMRRGRSRSRSRSKTVVGTMYGRRKGRMKLAVQAMEEENRRVMMVVELGMESGELVREMAKGPVRIVVEEEQGKMWCNGRRILLAFGESKIMRRMSILRAEDRSVLDMIGAATAAAGILPAAAAAGGTDVLFMRSLFQWRREAPLGGAAAADALYMINPDGRGRPEISFFFFSSSSHHSYY